MMNGNLSRAVWRKSTRSGGQENCVEVTGNLPGIVAVRDSKNAGGPALRFAHGTWDSFTSKVKSGKYDEELTAALRRAPRLPGGLSCA
jgi:hypothetical protein